MTELGVEALEPAGLRLFELSYRVPLPDGGHALVFTDALFNLDHMGGLHGFLLRYVSRSTGHFGLTRVGRVLLVRDKRAFATWLHELADHEGLRVICVGHGHAIVDEPSARLHAAAAAL